MCGLQSGPGGPKNMLLMKVRNKQVVSYRVILPICEYVLTVYLISSKITLFADFSLCVMDKWTIIFSHRKVVEKIVIDFSTHKLI